MKRKKIGKKHHNKYLIKSQKKIIKKSDIIIFIFLCLALLYNQFITLKPDKELYSSLQKNQNIFLAEFKHHSPVIFSDNIEQFKPTRITNYYYHDLLLKYDINYDHRFSKNLLVTNKLSTSSPLFLIENFQHKILSHNVEEDNVTMKIQTSSEIWARLSYIAFPYTHIFLNDKKIDYYETPEGHIVIKLKKGINQIKIIAKVTKPLNFYFI